MSKLHNNESDSLSTARTERSASVHRADGAQGSASPRLVITGENLAEKSPILTGENLLQTDRVQFLTDGRYSKIVLHPIPLESVSPQIAHIDWFAFTLTPPKDAGVVWLIQQLPELFGICAAMPTGKGWNGYLSEVQVKIRTLSKAVKISYKRAVENARQMVGKTVNVMMQFLSGDYAAVVNELKRDGIPKRLENYADFLPQVFAGGST